MAQVTRSVVMAVAVGNVARVDGWDGGSRRPGDRGGSGPRVAIVGPDADATDEAVLRDAIEDIGFEPI